jgi:predicted phosphodiesterase
MALNKRQKVLVILCVFLIIAIVVVFTGKGKHSLKNKLIDSYDSTKSNVSMESQHDWFRFIDFIHGYGNNTNRVGWISDIHADRFKRRDVPSGLMFPRQYGDYLTSVFDDMQKQGIMTVVATGDNTNTGDVGYAQDLARIAYSRNMHVIWVKGNHDNDEVMNTLGITGNKYYYADYENTRIIVLNDVDGDINYNCSIDQNQMDWLKGALKTEKQVMVAMHIPIFNEDNVDKIHEMHGGNYMDAGKLLDSCSGLESILHESGNVKMVITGHWHVPWNKKFDGIDYYGEAALTRESYSRAYATIDLNANSVNYLFAK